MARSQQRNDLGIALVGRLARILLGKFFLACKKKRIGSKAKIKPMSNILELAQLASMIVMPSHSDLCPHGLHALIFLVLLLAQHCNRCHQLFCFHFQL